MSRHADEMQPTTPEERALIERLRAELDPGPATAAERATLRSALAAQAEHGARAAWRVPALTAATALGAALLWLALPARFSEPTPGVRTTQSAEARPAPRGFLAYAYYETDYLAESTEAGSEDFLPAGYAAIATLFEVP